MTTYISCTDTAKLIRKALKDTFPGIKFSVKKSAGGSSIYVRWTDGPSDPAVEKVCKFFEGATFDSSVDLKSYVTTEMNGEEVQFGADYVICQRDMSYGFVSTITKQFCDRRGMIMLKIEGTQEHAWVNTNRLDYYTEKELRHLLLNTDAKDVHRAYQAEDEREARERAQWEAGAAERERKAREQAAKAEQERQERERREAAQRKQREEQARESARKAEEARKENQRQENIRLIQRTALASRINALMYLGCSTYATRSDIMKAFREKVKESADGKGGYQGDMDFLVKVKEKALM